MSLNDNGWNNKPGGRNGPPDLEDLWRDLNRRLAGLFGKRGGGGDDDGGARPPSLSPAQFGGGIGLLAMLIVVVWLASGFYVVEANQRGIVLQFGRYKDTTGPGLNWRLPWPIQTQEVVNLSGVRTIEIGYRGSEKNKVPQEALMLTDEQNIVSVEFAVQWLLKDPKNYVFKNYHPEETVVQAAETAIREVVGKNKMDFVLYEGRDKIASDTSTLMQQILDRYETGIQIRSVTMQSVQPPEQVQAAFDDAVKAGQDKEKQINEGQAYSNDVVPKARGTAAALIEEANGYKGSVINRALGDASRFSQILVEYDKAPQVMRSRMYLDTLQQIYNNSSKIMIDAKGNGNLLYLPLDKLMQAAGAVVPVPAPADQAPARYPMAPAPMATDPVPPQSEKSSGGTDFRSRSFLDSRERGER